MPTPQGNSSPSTLASTAAAVALLAVLGGPAEPQTAPLAEVIDIELVNVDVWVTDKSGRPVHGLESADFEILHDGQPVEVSHFREIRSGRTAGSGAAAGAPSEDPAGEPEADSPPTHVVVYFDQTRLRPTHYQPLIGALRELLAAEAVAPQRVLLLRQKRALSVEQPFGSSRKELEAALSRIGASPPPGFDADTDTRLAVDAIRDVWDQNRDSLGSAQRGIASIPDSTNPGQPGSAGGSPREVVSGIGSTTGPDACGSFLSQIQPILTAWTRSRSQAVEVTLANLTDAASFLAGLPGVKILLYLSDGLETEPGTDLATYAAGLCPAGSAEVFSGIRSESMTDRFLELTRHANANRVTVHALQTSGLSGSRVGDASSRRQAGGAGAPRAGRAFEASRRSVERQGLTVLASETGGRAIFNRNEPGAELVRIAEDAGNYYSLAYSPLEGGDAREHRIEVRLRRDAGTARYRQGYVEKDSKQWLGERVEGALNLGITSNALGVKLATAAARPGAGGGFVVPLHVIIPAERLAFLPRGDGHAARVTIQVMARGVGDNTLTIWDRNFRVGGTPGASGWADLVIDLDLPAGTFVTGVGVRDDLTQEASFLATAVEAGAGG